MHISIKSRYDNYDILGEYTAALNSPLRGRYLLLHGLTSDRNEYLGFYREVAERLSAAVFASLRIDNRAHGSSTAPPATFNLRTMFADVMDAIRWLQAETHDDSGVSLFATSFGAPAAMIVAAVFPRLVRKLILLAPVSDFDALYIHPLSPMRAEKLGGLVEKTLLRGESFHVGSNVAFERDLVFEFLTVDLLAICRRIAVPILIMHGTDDGVVPITLSENILAANPTAKLVRLPDTEHGFTMVRDYEGSALRTRQNVDEIMFRLIED